MTQLWAIQTKLGKEDSTVHLVDAFHKLGLNWGAFPLIPFQHAIPDFHWEHGPIVYYGSTGLIQRVWGDPDLSAKARLFWSPGTHATAYYGAKLGPAWLNHGARFTTMEEFILDRNMLHHFDAIDPNRRFFFRPDSGGKPFAGGAFTVAEFGEFAQRMVANGLKRDLSIVINKTIDIECEFRTWIIGGEVVACVGYKANGQVRPWYETEGSTIDREVRKYAQAQGARLAELEAFVLDVAVAEGGLRVVEINDIHASGFYLTDHILDVVAELSNYVAMHPERAP